MGKTIIIHQQTELHPSHVGFCIMSVRRQRKGFTMNLCMVITTVWLKTSVQHWHEPKVNNQDKAQNSFYNIVCSLTVTRANQSKNKLQPKAERNPSSKENFLLQRFHKLVRAANALREKMTSSTPYVANFFFFFFLFLKAASDHLAFRARHTSTPREDKLQIYFSRRWPFAPF